MLTRGVAVGGAIMQKKASESTVPEISEKNAVSSAKPAFVEHLTSSWREAAEDGVP